MNSTLGSVVPLAMFAIYIAMHEEAKEGQLKNYSVQICGKTEDQGDDSDDWMSMNMT